MPETFDIFLSYRREDLPIARTLCDLLLKAGLKVWIDLDNIPPGALWEREIQQKVNASRIFVPLLTPSYTAGSYQQNEIEIAEAESVNRLDSEAWVIPLLWGLTTLPTGMPAESNRFLARRNLMALPKAPSAGDLDPLVRAARDRSLDLVNSPAVERVVGSIAVASYAEHPSNHVQDEQHAWSAQLGAGRHLDLSFSIWAKKGFFFPSQDKQFEATGAFRIVYTTEGIVAVGEFAGERHVLDLHFERLAQVSSLKLRFRSPFIARISGNRLSKTVTVSEVELYQTGWYPPELNTTSM